jgi:hypothetical protein
MQRRVSRLCVTLGVVVLMSRRKCVTVACGPYNSGIPSSCATVRRLISTWDRAIKLSTVTFAGQQGASRDLPGALVAVLTGCTSMRIWAVTVKRLSSERLAGVAHQRSTTRSTLTYPNPMGVVR